MKNLPRHLLRNHLIVHNRYKDEEYLIDQSTYEYMMNFISLNHQSLYTLPDGEMIDAAKIITSSTTIPCRVKINELIFE